MGQASYDPYTVPRPKPKTWQQSQEQAGQDRWNAQGEWVDSDRAGSAAGRARAGAGADAAYSDFMGGRSTNTEGYAPSATTAFQPSRVGDWLSTGAGAGGVAGAFTAASGGTALAEFDPSDVRNFDPSAFGEKFARGAFGDFKTNLGDELDVQENASARAGRTNSGLYDRDRGRVINRAAATFEDKLAQEAGVFSGQRLNAMQSGAQMALARAQGLDANTMQLSEFNASGAADMSRFNAGQGLARRGQDLTAATTADQMTAERGRFLDTTRARRAEFLDSENAGRARTGLEAALTREAGARGEYENAANRAGDYASATREWGTADRAAQDARDEIERLRNPWGRGKWGGGANPSVQAANDAALDRKKLGY